MPIFLPHTKEAFEDLKAYLSFLPLLSPSKPGEELFLHLAVSPAVVSTALVREEDKAQKPTSRALHGAKERYPPMVKLKPLRRAMSHPEATRQMALWAIKLSEFNIQYRPCTTIKGQVVADFIAEFTNMEG